MRDVLEELVQALLVAKPEDVNEFCLQWLTKWYQEKGVESVDSERLRAERDLLLEKRDSLLKQLGKQAPESTEDPGPAPASSEQGQVPGIPGMVFSTSLDNEGGSPYDSSPSRKSRRLSRRAASPATDDDDEKERAKIAQMQKKDRRAAVSASVISEERLQAWKKPFYEKDPKDRERLKALIDSSERLQVLFGHLTEEHLYAVIDAMFPKEVLTGNDIIRQGEDGDNFYIVDEGTFDVFVARADAAPGKVHQYGPGDMFGELALMYNARRAATVHATSNAKLWALDRDSFQMMLTTVENTKKKQYEGFLEAVDILKDLTKFELAQLSDLLQSEVYDPDEEIIVQGEDGSEFFILEDGEAKAFISGDKGEVEVKHYVKPGEYFGEIALLTAAPRKATVRAAGRGCSVLWVDKSDFDLVLGPIKDILAKDIDKYPQYADFIRREEQQEAEDEAELKKIQHMKDSNRRAGVSAPAISEDRMKAWTKPFHVKPEEVRESIKKVFRENERAQVLFGHLTESTIYEVIDAMKPVEVAEGTSLITQGEEGDNFYIVDQGSFDVYVKRGDQPATRVLQYGPGSMFGELALMYNAPRAATVRATSSSKVWALDRESFQLMLATAENTKKAQYEEFLSNIEVFQLLTKYEMVQLSDLLVSELFDSGEEIVKQGDEGDRFYILEDGEAKAFIHGAKGEVEVKHYCKPGEYFGEVALITDAPRRATVRAADGACQVLSVSRKDFDMVLGPIRRLLQDNIDKYPAYAEFLKD